MLAIGVLGDDQAKVRQASTTSQPAWAAALSVRRCPSSTPRGWACGRSAAATGGHTMTGVGLMGAICQMAWKQGFDWYGHDDNRFMKGAAHVAKFNLDYDVPFTA
ncbi:hypothetical protein [Streptomyces mirabilis]|uniref:hypothetical protein n=1 Tax=Streptomyces mirabilis TaxID=68239 RepID=UPI00365D5CEB